MADTTEGTLELIVDLRLHSRQLEIQEKAALESAKKIRAVSKHLHRGDGRTKYGHLIPFDYVYYIGD
jgi:hypothetical protein